MNKSYKTVWNETTGTYVAASETAKGRGKKSRNHKALVLALLAAGVGFGTAVKSEAAATPDSFAAGILGTNSSNSDCISSADGAQVITNGDCSAAAQQAGIVSYDGTGKAGAYFTVTDPKTTHIGAGGIDQMRITDSGVFVLNALNMGGNKVTNLAAGDLSASSKDAVNGSQLYTTNTDVKALQTTTGKFGVGFTAIAIGAQTPSTSGSGSGLAYDTPASAGTGANSIAIGGGSVASSSNSTALGSGSLSVGQALAVGANAVAGASGSTSVGYAAGFRGMGTYSSSLGWMAQAAGNSAVAVGSNASAAANNSVALGNYTLADRINTVAVGGRQVVSVAAGTQSTDAVNYAQLQAAGLTVDANGNATNAFVAYDGTDKATATLGGASGTTLTNVKAGTLSALSTDTVNGSQLYATNQSVAQNTGDIAQNASDIAKNTSDIATNAGDIAKNTSDITNLDTRVTNVEGSVADLANQFNSGVVGLVQQDQTTGAVAVASNTGGSSVDFTGTAGTRELLGVAAGTTSNSAVNLGQLSPVVSSLGGGAQINADGSVTGPAYHVQGGTQTTVGGALGALDTGLSSLQTQISSGSIGVITQDATSRDLLVGTATDGVRVNFAGTAGNRVVTGISAGAVDAASADAVNGSQLYANASSTAAALGGGSSVNADGTISAPSYSVGGTAVNNVGAAITNIDGRVTQNTSDIASLQSTVGSISGSVANAVSYDTAAHNQVTLGGSDAASKVRLTNLQDGELSATSSDAVTGAQLWNTNQQLSDLSQSMQNQQQTGSQALSIGTGSGPAAAATGSNAMAIGGGSQASGDNSVAIGSGSVADEANTVSVGSQGNERRVTNVANGQAGTDAVNMRQFQSGMGEVARNAYSGVAAATALTMIPEVDPGKTLAVGVAGANYKGYQAMAVGASARITANLKVKVGAGVSGNNTTVGAGASYQW
jgi:autotransporter adhesin